MRYAVKFLGLIGLGLGVIYTFYINGNVSSYGFWAWTLSVIVSLLTLCNVASLIAALNYSSYNEDKVDDEKGMLVLSSFLGFLIYCGIFFFSINQEGNPDWIYLSCCFLAFLISNGFNRLTWAFAFLGFTQYIFFCWNDFAMNSWYSWAIYIFIMFIHVTSVIFTVVDRLDSDPESEPIYPIEKFGLLIPIIVFIYIWFTNNAVLQTEINTLLVLCYLLLFILSSIRDSVNMFLGITIVSVIYLLIYPSSFELHLLILISASCTLACIIHNLHQSILLSKLEDAIGYNIQLGKELTRLKIDYDKLRNSSNSGNDSRSQKSGNKITDGFLSGLGRGLAEIAIDFFS